MTMTIWSGNCLIAVLRIEVRDIHRDYKHKRAKMQSIQTMELREEKHINPKALEKFREKPYQQRYAERLSGGRTNDDRW